VRISSEILFIIANADAVSLAEGSIRTTDKRGWLESPESLARGMLSKGFPVNPGELPTSPEQWVWLRPTQTEPGLVGHEGFPAGSE
jgi:hypothetical protein